MLKAAIGKMLQAPPPLGLDQMYAQAVVMDPIFRVRVQRLAGMCDGCFYVTSVDGGNRPVLRLWREIELQNDLLSRVCWPAIKHVDSACRKVDLYYHGSAARLVDVVRQRIIFNSLADIRVCLQHIQDDPNLQIVRVKNRFDASSDAHRTACYRDVVLVLRVVTPTTQQLGVAGHCCELQLAHREMVRLMTNAEHARYLKYKSVMRFVQKQSTWSSLFSFKRSTRVSPSASNSEPQPQPPPPPQSPYKILRGLVGSAPTQPPNGASPNGQMPEVARALSVTLSLSLPFSLSSSLSPPLKSPLM